MPPDDGRITVAMNIVADEYDDQLRLTFASGEAPDTGNMNTPRQKVAVGWPEPADDRLAANPDVEASFLPGAFVGSVGICRGKTPGLPMSPPTMRLNDNRRLFQEPGLDPVRPPATHGEFPAFGRQTADAVPGSRGLTAGTTNASLTG